MKKTPILAVCNSLFVLGLLLWVAAAIHSGHEWDNDNLNTTSRILELIF